MRREASTPRPGWQQKLEQLGFDFYMLEGKAYWTEQACYAFTSEEIDTLERVYDNFFMGLFGVLSIVIAHSRWAHSAGLIYFLICIPKTLVPWIMGVKRSRREDAMLAVA